MVVQIGGSNPDVAHEDNLAPGAAGEVAPRETGDGVSV